MPRDSSLRRSRLSSSSTGRSGGRLAVDRGEDARGLAPLRPRALLLLALGEVGLEAAGDDPVHQVEAVERVAGVGDPAAGVGLDAVLLDVLAGQRGAAQHHRQSSRPWRVISTMFSRITTVDLTSRPDMPIASARCSSAAARMLASGCLMPRFTTW